MTKTEELESRLKVYEETMNRTAGALEGLAKHAAVPVEGKWIVMVSREYVEELVGALDKALSWEPKGDEK